MVRLWIFVVGLLTMITLLIFGSVQYVLRMNANDPQIELAENTAQDMAAITREAWVDQSHHMMGPDIDYRTSLSAFTMLFDEKENFMVTNAIFVDSVPTIKPPPGVFAFAKEHKEHRFTWEPIPGVRIASVMIYYRNRLDQSSGYVLVGRNLREVEKRVRDLEWKVGLFWIVAIGFTTISLFTHKKLSKTH